MVPFKYAVVRWHQLTVQSKYGYCTLGNTQEYAGGAVALSSSCAHAQQQEDQGRRSHQRVQTCLRVAESAPVTMSSFPTFQRCSNTKS